MSTVPKVLVPAPEVATKTTANAPPRVRSWPLLAYALPTAAAGAVAAPVAAILPSLYAKYASVSVTALGTLFVVLRLFDAVSDPLIGYWSDRTRSRRFGRKPWIIAGGLLLTISVYFLFQVPPGAGIAYLTVWAMVFYLGYTMHEVPHMAWGGEITADYSMRAKVFSFRSMADIAGGMVYTLLPLGLFFFGVIASTDYTPAVFHWLALAAMVLFPLLITIAVCFAPAGEPGGTDRSDLRGLFNGVFKNPPLQRFLAAYMVAGVGSGIFAALFFPYFDSYLHIGNKLPHLLLAAMAAAFVSQPFWARMVARFGKHRTWGYGWIANSLALLPMLWLRPGEGAFIPAMLLVALYSFTNGVSSVAPFSLLADIVDYEVLKRRVDLAGNYYALLLFIAKVMGSVGGLVLAFLGAVFGYQLVEGAVNTDAAKLGIVIAFCVLPSLFQIMAVPLIWNFPIDRRRHATIRRRIEQREARAAHHA